MKELLWCWHIVSVIYLYPLNMLQDHHCLILDAWVFRFTLDIILDHLLINGNKTVSIFVQWWSVLKVSVSFQLLACKYLYSNDIDDWGVSLLWLLPNLRPHTQVQLHILYYCGRKEYSFSAKRKQQKNCLWRIVLMYVWLLCSTFPCHKKRCIDPAVHCEKNNCFLSRLYKSQFFKNESLKRAGKNSLFCFP